MIDTYLQDIINHWPIGLQSIGNAMRVALPVILIGLVVWLLARAIQRWIDRMEAEHPAQMRTADAQQIERDVNQLWQRWPDTVPPPEREQMRMTNVETLPARPRTTNRVRAGLRIVPPADRPAP